VELLLDIGNTHTHVGAVEEGRIQAHLELPTSAWYDTRMLRLLQDFFKREDISQIGLCSVVPPVTEIARRTIPSTWGLTPFVLDHRNICTIGIDYPAPHTIGTDRLANSIALAHYYGAPSIAIDFGTAVTFDIVNEKKNYVGGIIVPGIATMTTYLHEKTAQLPAIDIRDVSSVIGKNTEDAIRIGAVYGYKGLIREILQEIKKELGYQDLPIVATGGYADLIATKLTDIQIDNNLTLKGLLLAMQRFNSELEIRS